MFAALAASALAGCESGAPTVADGGFVGTHAQDVLSQLGVERARRRDVDGGATAEAAIRDWAGRIDR